MSLFYKAGSDYALSALGMQPTDNQDSDASDFKGTPFPAKSPSINAERLAEILRQQEDDDIFHQAPENKRYDPFNRPTTWSAPTNISGLDDGRGAMGIILPSNPRG